MTIYSECDHVHGNEVLVFETEREITASERSKQVDLVISIG